MGNDIVSSLPGSIEQGDPDVNVTTKKIGPDRWTVHLGDTVVGEIRKSAGSWQLSDSTGKGAGWIGKSRGRVTIDAAASQLVHNLGRLGAADLDLLQKALTVCQLVAVAISGIPDEQIDRTFTRLLAARACLSNTI